MFYVSILCNLFARDIELCNQFIESEDWEVLIEAMKNEKCLDNIFPLMCTLLILVNDQRGERVTTTAVGNAREKLIVLVPVIMEHIQLQLEGPMSPVEGIQYRKQTNYAFLKIGISFLRVLFWYEEKNKPDYPLVTRGLVEGPSTAS